jgi:formylglycine-generating enzyme required for sulfatase activity
VKPRTVAVATVALGLAAVYVIVSTSRLAKDAAACGPGFSRAGARCCPSRSTAPAPGACASEASSCPSPLVPTPYGCDAPERDVVDVPATTVTVGPSDWEAEGRVAPRTAKVEAFAIDRLEVTVGRACASPVFTGAPFCGRGDPARAAFGVTLFEARQYCRLRGGRLPTDDEWLAAAGGDRPRRYPWGDTGAVCRRAAWGLDSGPCGERADGPDTAGAHADGATPLGIHDLAGNVAEWVETGTCDEPGRCTAVVRGGSWRSALATELRTWLRREVSLADAAGSGGGKANGNPTIGFRCAYGGVRWSVP